MNKVANTYWTDARLITQRPLTRTAAFAAPAYQLSQIIGVATRSEIRRRTFTLPSWVLFSMIILATFGACITVTMRTHAEMRDAEHKYARISTDVEKLRNTNAAIEREVKRLQNDPRAIEAAARTRLNMVRANEIVVPIK